METLYKWLGYLAALLLVIGLSFGGGYLFGKSHQESIQAIANAKQATKDTKKAESIGDLTVKADASSSQGQTKILTKYITVEKEVRHYARKNINASDVLDSNWVLIYNHSANGDYAGNSTINSTASQPVSTIASGPTATKAEAIDSIIQHDKAYFTCKQGFDDLFNFYNSVRSKINSK